MEKKSPPKKRAPKAAGKKFTLKFDFFITLVRNVRQKFNDAEFRKKYLRKRFVIPAAAAVLFVIIGFVPIRLGYVKTTAEEVLRGAGADSVSIGSVSFVLFKGVVIKDVKIFKRINARESYRVRVESVDVSANLATAANILTEPNMFTSGRDVFREFYEKPLEVAIEMSGLIKALSPINKVAVHGAGVTFFSGGGAGVSAGGIEAVLHRRDDGVRGHLSAKTASVQPFAEIRNFEARLRLHDGRLDLYDGGGAVFGGRLGVHAAVDLSTGRFVNGALRVRGLDLERYCAGTNFAPGRLGGRLTLDAALDSNSLASIDSIRARATFTVAGLTASETGIQRTSEVNRMSSSLRSLRFDEVTGNFRLSGGRLRFGEIAGRGDVMSFRSTGWAMFDGRINQDFEGTLTPQFAATLPHLVRSSLERAPDGGGRFTSKITGTFHNPNVEVDWGAHARRAIRNLFR